MIEMKSTLSVPELNPFTPTSGIEPKRFVDRDEEVRTFLGVLDKAKLGRCEHFIVVGPWGSGKTVLLKEFKNIAQRRNVPAALVSASSFTSRDRELDGVRDVVQQLASGFPVELGRLERFYNLMESIGVEIVGFGVNFTKESKELSPRMLLEESLLRLWSDLSKSSDAVLILIDDVQNWSAIHTIFTTLRNVLSGEKIVKGTRVIVGLACTPDAWSRFMLRDHPIGRYFVPRMNMGKLSKEDTIRFIDTLLEGTGVSFAKEIRRGFSSTPEATCMKPTCSAARSTTTKSRGRSRRTCGRARLIRLLQSWGNASSKASTTRRAGLKNNFCITCALERVRWS